MNEATKIKFIVYAAVLLDVLSIWIFIPASEKLITWYSTTPFWITLWLSIYSLSSFISTPVLGQLSDKYGRKKLLLFCVFGTAISYLILLLTHSYWIYIVSRMVNGITGGNFAILQSIISDISKDETDRKKNFWLMGGLFWLWFIIWPILGSVWLSAGGLPWVFWIGAILSIIDLVLIYFMLDETNTLRHENKDNKIDYFGLKTLYSYLINPNIWVYLRSMMLLWIWFFIHQWVMAIQVKQTYGIWWESFGYVMALFGLVSMVNLAFLIPKFRIPRFTSKTIIYISHIWSIIIMWLMAFAISNNSINILWISSYHIYLVLIWLLVIFNIYQMVYQSEIISHSDKNKVWEISWVTTSIQNIWMIVWPLIWWVLLDTGINVYIWGLLLVAASGALVWINRSKF